MTAKMIRAALLAGAAAVALALGDTAHADGIGSIGLIRWPPRRLIRSRNRDDAWED